jgi:hypothetical protein
MNYYGDPNGGQFVYPIYSSEFQTAWANMYDAVKSNDKIHMFWSPNYNDSSEPVAKWFPSSADQVDIVGMVNMVLLFESSAKFQLSRLNRTIIPTLMKASQHLLKLMAISTMLTQRHMIFHSHWGKPAHNFLTAMPQVLLNVKLG